MSRRLFLVLLVFLPGSASAQTLLTCSVLTSLPLVRAKGITERTSDVVFNCSGGNPSATITGNLTLFLPVNITNRIAPNSIGAVTDVVFTADIGAGPQPVNVSGLISGPATLAFNGLSFTLSPTGSVVLRIANIRVAANELPPFPNSSIVAQLSFTPLNVLLASTQVKLGSAEAGLFAGFSSKIFCATNGSPMPVDVTSLASFQASSAVFNTTRVTEGFADAFNPRAAPQNMNADTGTRFLVRYAGFPPGARLFVPNAVAGSDAVQPTGGGDFGVPASGGKYAPGGNGSLLLALVQGADANGAGGAPVFTPGAPGSGTVSFDAMSEITLANGAGTAVYEVMDANPLAQENAQFPTFLVLAPISNSVQTTEDVSFAPVSTVVTATARDPIPRFQQVSPAADCTIVGDCGANYFPILFVVESSLAFSIQAPATFDANYVQIHNNSGGVLRWNATVTYQSGSGWLQLTPSSGVNNSTMRVDALAGNLAPGVYHAILSIDAGPVAGSRDIPVSLTIAAAPTPTVPAPAITSIVNTATWSAGPVAPGSLATVAGSHFSGAGLIVTMDGAPAQVLSSDDAHINLLVPLTLGTQSSAQLVVSVNAVSSQPFHVALAPFAPGIFPELVLNDDFSLNGPANPAALGSIVHVFVTGLPSNGTMLAKIGDQPIGPPYASTPAAGLPGTQQIDLLVPMDWAGDASGVSLCGGASPDQMVCSPAVPLAISQAQ